MVSLWPSLSYYRTSTICRSAVQFVSCNFGICMFSVMFCWLTLTISGPHTVQMWTLPHFVITKIFIMQLSVLVCLSGKIASPKWKSFKGLRLLWWDKIRLNNGIWRAWFIQCECGPCYALPARGLPPMLYCTLPENQQIKHSPIETDRRQVLNKNTSCKWKRMLRGCVGL